MITVIHDQHLNRVPLSHRHVYKTPCKWCHGQGGEWLQGKWDDCPRCSGTGEKLT